MRRLAATALAVLLCASTARGTVVSGFFSNPDGSGFNGRLIIQLQRTGLRNTCVFPSVVAPTAIVPRQITNGILQPPPNFLLWSQALQTTPAWNGAGGAGAPTVTGNTTVAPDGSMSAAA